MEQFDSMEQRIINMYIDLFPSYRPNKDGVISEASQRQFYEFMGLVFKKLYENPLLLFSKINPDDFFIIRFNKNSENKKESYTKLKKCVKTLQDFSEFLYGFGKNGQQKDGIFAIDKSIKIQKKYINILQLCNIEYSIGSSQAFFQSKKYPELFCCWEWFSKSPKHSSVYFISCMFDKDYSYTSDVYSKLSNDKGAFEVLESFLIKNNYRRIDNRDNKVNLDYVKEYDKKESILKAAWGERTHGGISAEYDGLMKNPPLFSLRIPYYKILLEESEKMSEELKDFVVNTGKKCDDCRYCVQLDKTGKKPLSFITVYHKNKFDMCTYFPSFYYCWEKLDQTIVKNIIMLLIFADEILGK